jgi:hypothetical protein
MAPDVARVLDALSRRGFWVGEDDVVFAGIDGGYLDGSALYRRYKLALKRAELASCASTTCATRSARP